MCIPTKYENGITIIATSSPSEELNNWARKTYKNNYRIIYSTPFDIRQTINKVFVSNNNFDAIDKLWHSMPKYSAKTKLKPKDKYSFTAFFVIICLLIYKFPQHSLFVAFIITSIFYCSTMALKTLLFIIGYVELNKERKHIKILSENDKNLPIYTILIPLYKEGKTLNKLINALNNMYYPKSKLDIKLIVEDDDYETINTIKELAPERCFEIIQVPYSIPRTKPKACNYALLFSRGEFVTIYDAEDIPEPDQLKKVLYKFYHGKDDLACVQARLNYFNRNENLLTRMFAVEYSGLFDFMLFGLTKLGIPIPLGGTSNHFRIDILQKLYAWDPYNVTEDADLGLRMAQYGYKCAMIDSLTLEEAPISIWAWIKQRTRWIKGHMQTYIVHMREPINLYKKTGFRGFFGIQFFLGAPILIFLISPIMWGLFALFIANVIEIPNLLWAGHIKTICFYTLISGFALQIAAAIAAVVTNKWRDMKFYSLIYPFYWILHSVASFRALYQLITKPYLWEKTSHGLSSIVSPQIGSDKRSSTNQQ